MNLYITSIKTPIGNAIVVATDLGICLLEFDDQKSLEKDILMLKSKFDSVALLKANIHIENLKNELEAYFDQGLKKFSIPIDMVGTDFQKQVWNELLNIPYGKTISYQQQATNINRHTAVRAVANANGKNKISIIIPCHRVIGNNGKLTGYAGGIDRKMFLLNLESSDCNFFGQKLKLII